MTVTNGIAKASKDWNMYPTRKELLSSDAGPETCNRRSKKYKNVDQYLETQFRVTKEIVLGPLRQGLKKFRDPYFCTDPDIEVYDDCTVKHWDDKKLTLKIDRTKNRENIKIPDVGNTVCLSHNNFKTFLIGTMNDKHPNQIISVQFYNKIEFSLSKNDRYYVITCGVNFEELLLTLTALKSLSASTFPLKEYLIDLRKITEPPEYFRCGLSTWSNLDTVGFDFSQFETLKAILNSKFSVVQGAAGTGKTMLGRQIVRIFLENSQLWYDKSPILVVTPSKTTLDVFVQGLDKVTKKIVRLTDDSKFQNQERFSLENHREIRRSKEHSVAENIKKNLLRRLSMIEEAIENALENTRRICDGVLNFRCFANLDPRFEKSWFTKTPQDQLVIWLLETNCKKFKNVKGETKTSDGFNSTTSSENSSNSTEQDKLEKEILQLEKDVEQIIKPSSSLIFSVSDVSNKIKKFENILSCKSSNGDLNKINVLCNKKKLQALTFQLLYVRKRLQECITYWPILEDTTKINVENPGNIVPDDRWKLYRHWLGLFEKHLVKDLERLREIRHRVQNGHSSYGGPGDVPIMKNALVIASTVDALKWHYKNLQLVGCRVAIFDDAEHILESQIVAGLTDRCLQLILLGNRQNFTEDDLHKNLFGRAILDGLPNYILELQHRMCPEIYEAVFSRSTISEHLLTKQCVYGLNNSIFFIDHHYPETETRKHNRTNEHEVSFLSRLAYRLTLNGYAAKDLTILTPYSVQASAFRKELNLLSHDLSHVPVKTLELFRGCESRIILLSLVYNNRNGDVGILGTQDIACLALSRAKEGLIIMGNAELMENCGVDLWTKFVSNMRIQNKLGPYLTLKCEYHNVTFKVNHYNDLDEREHEGGCSETCNTKLVCGHICTRTCHLLDQEHKNERSCTQCNNFMKIFYSKERSLADIRDCGHPRLFGEDKHKCLIMVKKKLPCGHEVLDKPCWEDSKTYKCPRMCQSKLPNCDHVCMRRCHLQDDRYHKGYRCYETCGKINVSCSTNEHRCERKCCQKCLKCKVLVEKKMPDCEHFVKIECHKIPSKNVNCEQPCQRKLSCGHDCRRKCFEKCGGCEELHQETFVKCGHAVQTKCSENSDSSLYKGGCVLKLPCGHSCKNVNNDPCTIQCHEIVKNVTLSCGHVLSETRCYLTKNDTELLSLCTRSCAKILRCGHMCSGTCGSCMQGRIHRLCTQKCSIPLICGHNCPLRCSEICVACEIPCPLKCPHQKCQNSCGFRCTPCQKTCPRQCQHVRCTKPCSEICDVEPCNKACPVVLPCRHLCAGFCGDPCPPLCKICHAVKLGLTKDPKSVATARFVLLEECGHVINHRGMEESVLVRGQLIRHVSCPECGTVVTSTQRYRNIAKTVVLDIVNINERMINKRSTSLKSKKSVLEKLNNLAELGNKFFLTDHLRQVLHTCLLQIWQNVGKPPSKNYRLGNALRAKLTILENILLALSPLKFDRQLDIRISTYAETLLTQLVTDVAYVTEQQVSDYFYELKRLSYLVNYNQLCCVEERFPEKSFTALDSLLEKMAEVIFLPTIFDEFVEIQAKIKLKESIDTVAKIIGVKLRLSDHRKLELPVAIGSRFGAWCKCPKGHYYTIFSMEYGQDCNHC